MYVDSKMKYISENMYQQDKANKLFNKPVLKVKYFNFLLKKKISDDAPISVFSLLYIPVTVTLNMILLYSC